MSNNFTHVGTIDVSTIKAELLAQPELWNLNPTRLDELGPHWESQDIALRYKDEAENIKFGFQNWSDEHHAEWYSPIDKLPSVKKLAFELMSTFEGDTLGAILIYKLEPGKKIYPHTDVGWNADNFLKFHICIQSNPEVFIGYRDDFYLQEEGSCHTFRNDTLHGVVNDGSTDHIALGISIKTDSSFRVPPTPIEWVKTNRPRSILCHSHG